MKLAFIVGSTQLGILTLVFALTLHPYFTLMLFFLMGIPYQVRDIAMRTLLQTHAGPAQLPQVFAAHQVISNIAFALGLLLMGFITEYYGPQIAYTASVILVLFSAALAYTLPIRASSRLPSHPKDSL